MPTRAGPPSSTRSTPSPRLSRTCAAAVGESPVKRLALGAAMGTPAGAKQSQRHRMRRHPQPHGTEPRRDNIRNARLLGKHQGKRAGPVAPAQFLGRVRPVSRQLAGRLERRPRGRSAGLVDGRPFTSKMRATACRVERVRSQAVHGLGGKGHQPAGADQFRRPFDLLRVDHQPAARHSGSSSFAVAGDLAGVLPDQVGVHVTAPGRHRARGPHRPSPNLVRWSLISR